MTETNGNGAQHPQFEERCLQLAKAFGKDAVCFTELPSEFQDFFNCIGYTRVCAYLVICDLNRGRSERQLARRYGLSRDQVNRIKKNSRIKERVL